MIKIRREARPEEEVQTVQHSSQPPVALSLTFPALFLSSSPNTPRKREAPAVKDAFIEYVELWVRQHRREYDAARHSVRVFGRH